VPERPTPNIAPAWLGEEPADEPHLKALGRLPF
jgi:hypothetical protein